MRPLGVGLLLALLVLAVLGGARADPALQNAGNGRGIATWTFSNPADYTFVNASLGGGQAGLAWTAGSFADTTQQDFSQASSLSNINLTASPGDVAIANLSQPAKVSSVVFRPDPAAMADNYLYKGNGGRPNYGTNDSLHVGNWGGGEWTRPVLEFPAFPIPGNASLVSVKLGLYLTSVATTAPMDISVHRILSSWTELGSNWDTRDGVVPWNTTGGDFDPTAVAIVAGVGSTPGWYEWNVTSLAEAWWARSIPNQGLLVRQVGDDTVAGGEKYFASSDASNATIWPTLFINYTTPSSTGVLISRVFDAGGRSLWGTVTWNATVPTGTTAAISTRTGDTFFPDPTWSGWSAPYAASGGPILSPSARYIEYRLVLTSTDLVSSVVHDVQLGYARYATLGSVVTQAFEPLNLSGWERLDVNGTAGAGQAIGIAYTTDLGASWVPVASGANLSAAPHVAIRLRILLSTSNTTGTPTVTSMTLGFLGIAAPGGGGSGPGSGVVVPWWAYLVPLVAVLPALGYWEMRKPRIEEVYVVHTDGLLVAHRYRERSSDKDDEILMGMLTAIQTFIKEAFSKESTSELRSMRMGDRNIEIVRGRWVYLAAIHSGERTRGLERAIHRVTNRIEEKYGAALSDWGGETQGLEGVSDEAAKLFPRAYRGGNAEGRA